VIRQARRFVISGARSDGHDKGEQDRQQYRKGFVRSQVTSRLE
jgi:hypothetical protein